MNSSGHPHVYKTESVIENETQYNLLNFEIPKDHTNLNRRLGQVLRKEKKLQMIFHSGGP